MGADTGYMKKVRHCDACYTTKSSDWYFCFICMRRWLCDDCHDQHQCPKNKEKEVSKDRMTFEEWIEKQSNEAINCSTPNDRLFFSGFQDMVLCTYREYLSEQGEEEKEKKDDLNEK